MNWLRNWYYTAKGRETKGSKYILAFGILVFVGFWVYYFTRGL